MRTVTAALSVLVAGVVLTGCQSKDGTGDFTMPDEVGKVLQTAQDDTQAAAGSPLYQSTSSDALGKGRTQILDRDWKVCSQTPAAGATVKGGQVVNFSVVKTTERCPG